MKTDDIISYAQLVHAESANLQRGMNFHLAAHQTDGLFQIRCVLAQLT